MKKLAVAIAVIALLAGALLYINSNLDGIVKGLIEEHGSAATRTPVRVAGVAIDIAEANAGISRLTVGNPEGFAGNAIEMEAFTITLDPASLTSDVIVIEEIRVKGARLNIEQNSNGNNLQQLQRNLDRGDSAESDDDDATKLIINRFTLEGTSAALSAPDFDEIREFTIPTITLRNIGSAEGGATGPEIAQQVLKPVFSEALQSAAAQAIRDKVDDALKDAADSLLRGVFGNDEDPQ